MAVKLIAQQVGMPTDERLAGRLILHVLVLLVLLLAVVVAR